MATTKSYSDLQQSKKLEEFLPLESADMEYILEQWIDEKTYQHMEEYNEIPVVKVDDDDYPLQPITHPCWSLAALLNVIPISYKDEGRYCFALINTNSKADPFTWCSCYEDDHGTMMFECYAENPVDACVDMIIKLKKFNLL